MVVTAIKIDILGSILVLIGLIGVIYALKELGKPYTDWPALLVSGVIGVFFLVVFRNRQVKSTSPMIDFTLLKHPKFNAGLMMAVLSIVVIVGVELLLSQRLQLVLGYTPFEAALYIIPIPLASVIAAPLAGMYLHKFGEVKLTVFGFTCTLIGVVGFNDGVPNLDRYSVTFIPLFDRFWFRCYFYNGFDHGDVKCPR